MNDRGASTSLPRRGMPAAAGACLLAALATAATPLMLRIMFGLEQNGGDTPYRIHMLRFLIFLTPATLLTGCLAYGVSRVGGWLHRHRFAIGAIIILGAVLLDINGSSMGIWNEWMGGDKADGVIWGTPRSGRTDEYAVGTALAFAQEYTDYGYFNDLFGNRAADMFIIKDAPVWTPAEVFRPFHWGYLLLGSSRGLAWYWAARLVALFLSAYQFFLMLGDDRDEADVAGRNGNGWACMGALMFACSPLVQWWYAVNSLPEMLIAMFVSLVCFDRYLRESHTGRRALHLAGILWSAGMYVLSLYPAWQVSVGYVLVAMIVATVVRRWRTIHAIGVRDALAAVGEILVFAMLLGSVFLLSRETLQDTFDTLYPGKRLSVGGGLDPRILFSSTVGVILPFREFVASDALTTSATEAATFIDLFPLGPLLAIVNAVRRRRPDAVGVTMGVVVTVLVVFGCVGMPLWLSRVLLLTSVPPMRVTAAIGVANVIMLINAAMHRKPWTDPWGMIAAAVVVVACGVLSATVTGSLHPKYVVGPLVLACGVCGGAGAYAMVARSGRMRTLAASAYAAVLLVTGMSVNPIQHSSDAFTEQPAVKQVQALQETYPGMWVVADSNGGLTANLLVGNGVKVLNALEVVPDLKTWSKLDPDGEWESEYNRYAFITVSVEPDVSEERRFQAYAPDAYIVRVTPADLDALGVRNILTGQHLDKLDVDGYRFERIGEGIAGRIPYRMIRETD